MSWGALALAIIVAGYVLQRVEEGLFISLFKMDMHVGSASTAASGWSRRGAIPTCAILTVATLAGRPDLGIATVAIWVAVCLVVHAVRIAQAADAHRRGPLKSWLA